MKEVEVNIEVKLTIHETHHEDRFTIMVAANSLDEALTIVELTRARGKEGSSPRIFVIVTFAPLPILWHPLTSVLHLILL